MFLEGLVRMGVLFDFFPILLFFAVYKLAGIYAATAVMIVAAALQMGITWWRKREVRPLHLLSTVLVLIFGSLTLIIHDEIFVKWKPTAVYWLFAIGFLASHWLKMPLIQRALGSELTLPPPVWRRLNLGWALAFAAMGAINLYVVYHYSTEIWVNFKLFGLLGLTLLFALAQGLYVMRYLDEDKA